MNEEESMIKDILISMLNSPEWQQHYQYFALDNCALFDESEEHKMDQHVVHKQFQRVMATIYDTFLGSLGMSEDHLEEVQGKVIKQLVRDRNSGVDVGQLLSLLDFNVFKAEMCKWLKKLDLEAYEELEDQEDPNEGLDDTDFDEYDMGQELDLENEQEELNLQIALLMSLDEPDPQINQELGELKQKKIELTEKQKKVAEKRNDGRKILDEKLPILEQKPKQVTDANDHLGFSQSDSQESQFESQPNITHEELAKRRQQATQDRLKKLKQRQQEIKGSEKEGDDSQPLLKKPELSAEEIQKRKQQAALIKNAIMKNDDN